MVVHLATRICHSRGFKIMHSNFPLFSCHYAGIHADQSRAVLRGLLPRFHTLHRVCDEIEGNFETLVSPPTASDEISERASFTSITSVYFRRTGYVFDLLRAAGAASPSIRDILLALNGCHTFCLIGHPSPRPPLRNCAFRTCTCRVLGNTEDQSGSCPLLLNMLSCQLDFEVSKDAIRLSILVKSSTS